MFFMVQSNIRKWKNHIYNPKWYVDNSIHFSSIESWIISYPSFYIAVLCLVLKNARNHIQSWDVIYLSLNQIRRCLTLVISVIWPSVIFLVGYLIFVRSIIQRCPWCNDYCRRKWTRRHEFKSWTRLIAFHIALITLGKVWIRLFSLQLSVNSRVD